MGGGGYLYFFAYKEKGRRFYSFSRFVYKCFNGIIEDEKKLIILIIIKIIIKLIIFNYYHIKKMLENQIVKALNFLILKQEKNRNLEVSKKHQRS